MPDPGHASLGVSWVGHLRVCNSHGGAASGRASEARGCPFARRDRHGNPLHTEQWFWRLLLALCAVATPEAVLGEWVAMLLRQWIGPLRKLHWCAAAARQPLHACSAASGRKRVFRPSFHRVVKCNRSCPNGKVQLWLLVKVARVVSGKKTKAEMWPQELKVNIPSGYDNVNLIWSSRG